MPFSQLSNKLSLWALGFLFLGLSASLPGQAQTPAAPTADQDRIQWQQQLAQSGESLQIRLNGLSLGKSQHADQIGQMLRQTIARLQQSPASSAHLEINGRDFRLKLPALGEGARGVVYAIEGTDEVLKLPKGTPRDFLVLAEEADGAARWDKARRDSRATYQVLEHRFTHPAGFYSVKKRVEGETLAEFFFRYRVYSLDGQSGEAIISRLAKDVLTHDARVRQVMKATMEMIRAIQQDPSIGLSLSPHNIMVSYADDSRSQVKAVTLIDVGLGPRAGRRYRDFTHEMQYLEEGLSSVNMDMRLGRDHLKKRTFHQVQEDRRQLKGVNVAGRELRVAGLTSEVHTLLMGTIAEVLRRRPGLSLRGGFFYGSRVMPRSEVNAQSGTQMPVADDGVQKNSVREGGLTTISDLETLVLLDAPRELSYDELNDIRTEFRQKFTARFMGFPIGIRFFSKPADAAYATDFDWVKAIQAERQYIPAPEQYLEFKKVQTAPACDFVFAAAL
ncbi:MAG: hypothetical protein KF802_03140 [Bdellovibrionaceae bacterium]|nr:hypothetical protein [Pseudobdellovibrionaceae bacterium]